jgi:type II secretory pathway component PulJ
MSNLMSRLHKCQGGLSLIELMVGLTVGLLVILAALALYASVAAGARDTLGSARLTSELRAAMDVMTADVRRAGFGGEDYTRLNASDLAVYESGACLVYSYDVEPFGEPENAPGDDEFFGFFVEGGELKMRVGAGDLSDCRIDGVQWHPITYAPVLVVDELESGEVYFSIEYQCISSKSPAPTATPEQRGEEQRCIPGQYVYQQAVTQANANDAPVVLIETRKINLRLRGHLANDEVMTADLSDEVLVRNHRVVVVEPSP